VKLLFDQNLSPKLVGRLADLFPNSTHVQTASLDSASDDEIWDFARDNGYTIVSKDEDYNQLSVLRNAPPKVIWLLLGNCTTSQVESLFRSRIADITAFEADPTLGTLALG
jgi:predicted nuclease of predicted toxin-antitoxin system